MQAKIYDDKVLEVTETWCGKGNKISGGQKKLVWKIEKTNKKFKLLSPKHLAIKCKIPKLGSFLKEGHILRTVGFSG